MNTLHVNNSVIIKLVVALQTWILVCTCQLIPGHDGAQEGKT